MLPVGCMTPIRAAATKGSVHGLWHLCRACGLPAHVKVPLVLALVLTCGGCPTVASVMPPLAVASPLAPNRGAVEGRLRGAALTGVDRSDVPAVASVYAPRGQVDGALSIRIVPIFSLRLVGGAGLDVGALPLGEDAFDAPDRAAWFGGALPTFHISLEGKRTGLDLGPEVRLGVMPATYDGDCDESGCTGGGDQFDVMPILGAHVSLWHEPDPHVRGYIGVGVRNQPIAGGAFGGMRSSYTSFGVLVFLPSIGVEVSFTDEVGMAAEVQWIAAAAPVVFYPTVGVSVFARFGDDTLGGRRRREVPSPEPSGRTLRRIPGG